MRDSGKYFDPPAVDTHKCNRPDADRFSLQNGWRCDCGSAWVREQVSQHGETWWQWKRTPEFDE
jgi:hypothetical protein